MKVAQPEVLLQAASCRHDLQSVQNVQAARQLRFTSLEEITALEAVINAYIHEAIEIEKHISAILNNKGLHDG